MIADISPLWISLKTAGLATVMTFFLGLAAAWGMLNYRGRWKSAIESLFISPMILPPTVVGFLLLVLLGKNGSLGRLLALANVNIVFTWYAAAIAAMVVSFPLMYQTAIAAFEQIDTNLSQAAKTLGASEFGVFRRIAFPLALPGILAGVTLAFARALGEFGATLMLAGNIPGQTQTIPMAIYFAVEGGAMSEAWFWSIAILAISLSGISSVNFWRRWRKRKQRSSRPFSATVAMAKSPQALPVVSSEGLFVEIQKRLPDFWLDVSFSADLAALGVLGASGAGKSLILRCIAGIETPDLGRIVLNGRVLFDSKAKINLPSRDRRVGFLFQNYALFPHLTVAENIAFGLPKGLSRLALKERVEAQLVAIQLQGMGNRYPRQLSGGQQQRVALARALASEPEALLFDEPLSALDTHLRYQIEKLLIANLEGYAGVTLFVTHNLEEAYRICPNLMIVEGGKIAARGPKKDIFSHPRVLSIAQLTGCKNFSRAVAIAPARVSALDWGCTLQVAEPLPETLSHLGLRAHQLMFTDVPNAENTFPCWLTATSETPHRMTLFLKLNSPPTSPHDYHLQAEVFKEKWETLQNLPLPWFVQLHPERLLLLSEWERESEVQHSEFKVQYSAS